MRETGAEKIVAVALGKLLRNGKERYGCFLKVLDIAAENIASESTFENISPKYFPEKYRAANPVPLTL